MNAKAPHLYLQVCSEAIMAQKTLQFLAWDTTKHRYEGQLITALGAELDARRRYDGFAVLLLKASDGTAPKGIPKIAKVMDGAIPASAGGRGRIDRIAKVPR